MWVLSFPSLSLREDEVLEEVPQVGKEVEVEDKKSSRV